MKNPKFEFFAKFFFQIFFFKTTYEVKFPNKFASKTLLFQKKNLTGFPLDRKIGQKNEKIFFFNFSPQEKVSLTKVVDFEKVWKAKWSHFFDSVKGGPGKHKKNLKISKWRFWRNIGLLCTPPLPPPPPRHPPQPPPPPAPSAHPARASG